MKHLKIQHLSKKPPQNTAAVNSTPKIQIFEIQNPKNTPLIPVCKYAKSNPWGERLVDFSLLINFTARKFIFIVLRDWENLTGNINIFDLCLPL